jgi:hypothetical protein
MTNWRNIFGYRIEPEPQWIGWLINRRDKYVVIVSLMELSSGAFWGYFGNSEEEAISNYNYLKNHPEACKGVGSVGGTLTWAYLSDVQKIRFIENVPFKVTT